MRTGAPSCLIPYEFTDLDLIERVHVGNYIEIEEKFFFEKENEGKIKVGN